MGFGWRLELGMFRMMYELCLAHYSVVLPVCVACEQWSCQLAQAGKSKY